MEVNGDLDRRQKTEEKITKIDDVAAKISKFMQQWNDKGILSKYIISLYYCTK